MTIYFRLQTTDYKLQTSDYRLKTPPAPREQKWFKTGLYFKHHPPPPCALATDSILQTTDHGLQTSEYKVQSINHRLQTYQRSDQRSKTTDYRFETTDYILQTIEYRFQTTEYRIAGVKNKTGATFSPPPAPLEQKWFQTGCYCKHHPPPPHAHLLEITDHRP